MLGERRPGRLRQSSRDNLSAEDDTRRRRLRPRRRGADTTTLASRATGRGRRRGGRRVGRPRDLRRRSLRRVRVDADNLSTTTTTRLTNIFVRDLVAGTTTLVSRAIGAGRAPAADDDSARSGHLRRRALRRLRSRTPTTSRPRRPRVHEHLRARPGRQHDDAGQPGAGPGRRRRPTATPSSRRSRRRQPCRLPVGRRQPLGRGQQRGPERLRARPSPRGRTRSSAARPGPPAPAGNGQLGRAPTSRRPAAT